MTSNTATHNTDVILALEFQKHLSNKSLKHSIIDNVTQKKGSSKQNCTNREYYVQHMKYFKHKYVKMYCATNNFPELQFLGPHKKPYGVTE